MKVNFIMKRRLHSLHLPLVLRYNVVSIFYYFTCGKDDLCPPIYPVTYPSVGIPCELRLHAFIKQNFGLVLLMLSESVWQQDVEIVNYSAIKSDKPSCIHNQGNCDELFLFNQHTKFSNYHQKKEIISCDHLEVRFLNSSKKGETS